MSGFNNPIVGGGGGLVYPSIHSPNFVHLATGWSINKDGTAEFTGLILTGGTFTGTNFVINSLGAFYYSGTPATGNLIASITPAAGANDGVGNPFKAGINNYVNTGGSAGLTVQLFNGVITFLDQQSPDPVTHNAAGGVLHSSGAGQRPVAFLDSPSTNVTPLNATIWSLGEGTAAGNSAHWFWNGFSIASHDVIIGGDLGFGTIVSGLLVGQNHLKLGPSNEFQVDQALLVNLAAAGNVIEAQLAADTSFRWMDDHNGARSYGPGNAPTDCQFHRLAANSLSAKTADLSVESLGRGLRVREGANCKQGTATLTAGTVVVSNTAVTASSRIVLTAQDNNSTGALRVSARTAGTSFTITSSNAADSGVVAYQIFEPA